MRNRHDNRRDFDENEHPRDARGRFTDDDESYGGREDMRYGGRGYGSRDRFGSSGEYGGYRQGGFDQAGFSRSAGYDRDYGAMETDWGRQEAGRGGTSGRASNRMGGAGYQDWAGGQNQGGGYGQGGRSYESQTRSWEGGSERDEEDYDPDYRHWRGEQMKKFDTDYQNWRQERRQKFGEDFDKWRSSRSGTEQTGQTSQTNKNK